MDDKQLYTLLGELKSGVDGIKSALDTLSHDTHKRIDRLELDLKTRINEISTEQKRLTDAQTVEDGKQDVKIADLEKAVNRINVKLAYASGISFAAAMLFTHGVKWLSVLGG